MNLLLLSLAIGTLGVSVNGQTADAKSKTNASVAGRSQTISARNDNTGQHPGTAAVRSPATITCVSAGSDIFNPQPRPSCFITAPGFSGDVQVNGRVGSSGPGTVTLNCNGQGNVLTCSASIQEGSAGQTKKNSAGKK
jgi:hypothetical protein